MRLAPSLVTLAPLLLLVAGLAACGAAPPSRAATSSPAPTASTTAEPTAAPVADPSRPPRSECDAFMEVVARTTTLRASIHREPSTAENAAGWALRTSALASEAKALPLTQEDLIVEAAGLATRMNELAKELRALAAVEKGQGGDKAGAAHKRVLAASEQVEVITREPAARCAGDPKQLIATPGKLTPAQIQAVVRDGFPKLRRCYEVGLQRSPDMQGRIAVRFVIGLDGTVTSAVAEDVSGGSTAVAPGTVTTPGVSRTPPIVDKQVVDCVVAGFKTFVFPRPEGGVLSVVYPVNFTSAE